MVRPPAQRGLNSDSGGGARRAAAWRANDALGAPEGRWARLRGTHTGSHSLPRSRSVTMRTTRRPAIAVIAGSLALGVAVAACGSAAPAPVGPAQTVGLTTRYENVQYADG